MTADQIKAEVVREAPVFEAATSAPTKQGDFGREGEVEPVTVRINEAIVDLDETALLKVGDESSARLSKQQDKTPMTESRFESGSAANEDSSFRNFDSAYALA